MPGHFENGIFIEQSEIEKLGDAMLTASYAHFQKYNELNPPAHGVVWLQSDTGFLVVCTPDPKYVEQLKKFVGRLK